MLSVPTRPFWIYATTLGLTAFVLNWCWEMAQMGAYTELAAVPWRQTVWTCTRATGGDVMITFASYGIGALAQGKLAWGATGKWNVYATGALLGALCATAYEWMALFSGRWSYSPEMPIVPIVGVGLWPSLQLTVLVPTALWAAWCMTAKR